MTPKDYQRALDAKNAVNLSGLVHSFSEVVSRILDEPDCTGTGYVNGHPISVLYATQIAYLTGLSVPADLAYHVAYIQCKDRAKEVEK